MNWEDGNTDIKGFKGLMVQGFKGFWIEVYIIY